jgi:MATE family multidrug resistance protein
MNPSTINKEILRLALPNILSNISVPLLSTVDVIFMGMLSGLHIGAVGLGGMIFSFLFWNFGFLRMGTTGLTAQAYGQKDNFLQSLWLYRSLSIAVLMGILVWILSPHVIYIAIQAMQVNPTQETMITTYLQTGFIAAPATLVFMVINGWLFGMQNALLPLLLTILTNLVNIGLSYWMVIHLNWDIKGVALGTVIAQYVGVIVGITIIFKGYNNLLQRVEMSALFDNQALLRLFRVNRDILLRTLCLSLTFAFFYSKSSAGGELFLAGNVILLQLLNWMSYGIDGFAYAAESLVGKYYGASDQKAMNRVLQLCFYWGAGLGLFYACAYGWFPDSIIGIFTKDQDVKSAALQYIGWMVVMPLAGFASYIWDGIYIGLTATRAMRDTMFLAFVAFFLSYWLGTELWHPVHGLWLALLIFLLSRGVLQWWFFKRMLPVRIR